MDGVSVQLWQYFVGVIGLLFLIGAFSALKNTRRYANTEDWALNFIISKLTTLVTAAATDADGAKAAQLLVPIADLQEGISTQPRLASSIIADRLSSIGKMRESHTKVSLSALQQMTLARETATRWLALPGFIANVCMMMGLLGTVIGLFFVLREISVGLPADLGDLTLEALQATQEQIRGVLAGMNTAFVATMMGIGSSIVLAMLNQYLSRAQAVFINRLDRFTVEDLLPATVPATEDESLIEEVSRQLDASLGRLNEAVNTNHSTLKALGTVETALVQIVDSVRNSRNPAPDRNAEVIGNLNSIVEQVARLSQVVVRATSDLPALLEEAHRANDATLERIDRLIQLQQHRPEPQQRQPAVVAAVSPGLKLALGCMGTVNVLLAIMLLWR